MTHRADAHDLSTHTADGHPPTLELGELVKQFYKDVRIIAHARLRRLPPSRTMHTATLLQEALLRLAVRNPKGWRCRIHFFADVKQAVRQAVADYVRRKKANKRDAVRVSDDAALDQAAEHVATPAQKLAVHQALERLEKHHPRVARMVFYRFYCGLTMPQIAETLSITTRSAERDWALARSWLAAELDASRETIH